MAENIDQITPLPTRTLRESVHLRLQQLWRWAPLLLLLLLIARMVISPQPLLDWFLTPDQRAQRLFDREEYAAAADLFSNPLQAGVAYYRAGDFEPAANSSSRDGSANGYYNAGNALVLLGQYEPAIQAYERALNRRPDWIAAQTNLQIARIRAERTKARGDEEGTGGMLEADEFVFDLDANRGGENQASTGAEGESTSDEQIQAMWLRRVQTRPADFMAARFAYQLAEQESTP
jgi:Ca-activated chloride channel family protein